MAFLAINDDYTAKQAKDLKHVLNPDCDMNIGDIEQLKKISLSYKGQFNQIIFERVGHGLAYFVPQYNLDLFISLFSRVLKDNGTLIYQSFRAEGNNNLIFNGSPRNFGVLKLMQTLLLFIAGSDVKLAEKVSFVRLAKKNVENPYLGDFKKLCFKNLGLQDLALQTLDLKAREHSFINSYKYLLQDEQFEFISKVYTDLLQKHNYRNVEFRFKESHLGSLLYYLEIKAIKGFQNKLKPHPEPQETVKYSLANEQSTAFLMGDLMTLSAGYNLYCITENGELKEYYNNVLNTKLKLDVKIMPHEFRNNLNSFPGSLPLCTRTLKHYHTYILAESKTTGMFFIIATSLDYPSLLVDEMINGLSFANRVIFSISLDQQVRDDSNEKINYKIIKEFINLSDDEINGLVATQRQDNSEIGQGFIKIDKKC